MSAMCVKGGLHLKVVANAHSGNGRHNKHYDPLLEGRINHDIDDI